MNRYYTPINIIGSSNMIIRKKAILKKEEKGCESIDNRKK